MRKKLIRGKYKNTILLGLILIFALVLRLVFFTGVDESDSLSYVEFANMLSQGESLKDVKPHGFRLGIIFPVAVLYSTLGVSGFTSSILILLISLASIVLIYKFGVMLFNQKVGLLSAFLLSFFPLDVVYSTKFMTDLPSAFFVALSVYFFLKSEKVDKKKSANSYCLFSGLSLGIAYLMKELSLIIALFFIIYTFYNKKIENRYFLIPLGFILIISLEFVFFFKLTGNPFFRYSAISSDWANAIIETNMYGRGDFPIGLFHYFYFIFTDHFLVLFYSFIFVSVFYCIANRKKETYPMLFWFIPLLLYLSFGSANITKYVLIPAASRFLFIINVPGILLLSHFLSQKEPSIKKILMPSILALLLATSIGYIYLSEHRFVLDDERDAYKYLKALPEKQVYTDHRTIRIFNYLSGYKDSDNIKSFNNYEFLNPKNTYALNLSNVKDSYVVINWKLINYFASSKKGIVFPKEIYYTPQTWILKKEIEKKGKDKIMIYYAP